MRSKAAYIFLEQVVVPVAPSKPPVCKVHRTDRIKMKTGGAAKGTLLKIDSLGGEIMEGTIFNIQKCSIHDGPGIRTLVFFKGCHLSCLWCANPESQNFGAEVMNFYVKCIGCGACEQICPCHAVSQVDGRYVIDRKLCTNCKKCAEVCFAESKKVMGTKMTVDEVMEEIRKDSVFYHSTAGGGVTFSGGEPFLQSEFLKELCMNCRKEGISTAVETCGYADFEKIEPVLPYLDYIFFDVKHWDSEVHKRLTGQGNEKILENLKRIDTYGIPITVRTPVVPGYNDNADTIRAIAEFCGELHSLKEYELLAYHELGISKYRNLEREYLLEEVKTPGAEQMERYVGIANDILMPIGKTCIYKK